MSQWVLGSISLELVWLCVPITPAISPFATQMDAEGFFFSRMMLLENESHKKCAEVQTNLKSI
jgi:hypothetical protein